MAQAPILTVTLNPALDLTTSAPRVVPDDKLRCTAPRFDPGGGGINVSRAIRAMGGDSTALVALGGATGTRLAGLLADAGLPLLTLPAPGETRQSVTVDDQALGRQYRFVMPGPEWSDADVEAALQAAVDALRPDALLVLSGSNPPGVPAGFAARLAERLQGSGARLVVDTSGEALAMAAAVVDRMASALFEALDPDATTEIRILPGITAMLAASARLGAPLGHDFCAINLSDNLKPWALIEKRLRLAAQADFAMAFYNPRSKSRPDGFAQVLDILRQECGPDRLICFARAVSTPDEALCTVTLAEATPEMADMRTVVILGNSATRRVGAWVYTPRSVP